MGIADHYDDVRRIAGRAINAAAIDAGIDPDDVVQSVFVRALAAEQAGRGLDPARGSLSSWIWLVAWSVFTTMVRGRDRQTRLKAALAAEPRCRAWGGEAERVELAASVASAVCDDRALAALAMVMGGESIGAACKRARIGRARYDAAVEAVREAVRDER